MTILSTDPSKEIFAKVIKETNTILLVIVHGIMEVIMITATWCCMHATGLPGDRLTGKHTHDSRHCKTVLPAVPKCMLLGHTP